jgi:hypothetical protein
MASKRTWLFALLILAGDNGCKGKNSCKGKGGCRTDGKKPPKQQ